MLRSLSLAVAFSLACSLSLPAAELHIGIAAVDITPPVGYRMSGYFGERFSTGVKDPLFAKAIVLEQGDQRAALVFCDLIGISAKTSAAARKIASEKIGIPAAHIAIAATHSHTGPLYYGELRDWFHDQAVAKQGADPAEKIDYPANLVERLVEVITKAHAAREPAQLTAGVVAEPRLTFNRRFHMKDGTVRFNPGQQNPDIVKVAGPIDSDVGLIRVRTAKGSRDLGALVVYALHLDTLGGTEYSADYPFFVQQELRKKLGADALCLFGAGTCGDLNHIDVSVKGRRKTDEIGKLLGETVVAALDNLAPVAEPDLAVARAVVEVPRQTFSQTEIARAKERMPLIGSRELSFLEQVEATKILDAERRYNAPTIPLEVQAFRISRDLAIVTLPGEVFVDLGLEIKRASPFKQTLVIELTNDSPAYIPTRQAFLEGSYETVNSRIAPGGGEKMVTGAIELLKSLAK